MSDLDVHDVLKSERVRRQTSEEANPKVGVVLRPRVPFLVDLLRVIVLMADVLGLAFFLFIALVASGADGAPNMTGSGLLISIGFAVLVVTHALHWNAGRRWSDVLGVISGLSIFAFGLAMFWDPLGFGGSSPRFDKIDAWLLITVALVNLIVFACIWIWERPRANPGASHVDVASQHSTMA
jgi:hypothetical protein